jgi:osmotically-inducible protein OsmY
MKKWLMASAFGATLAYFLDPNSGTRRRNVMADKIKSWTGKGASQAQSQAQYQAGQAYNVVREAVSTAAPHDNDSPDDNTLRDRVESEVFRSPDIGRENVNVDVVGGVVTLRGELLTQAAIDGLVAQVRAIRNVKGVENYLHLPGTPAPNKESAINAS